MNPRPASDAALVADIRQRINTSRRSTFLTKQWSLHCGDNSSACFMNTLPLNARRGVQR